MKFGHKHFWSSLSYCHWYLRGKISYLALMQCNGKFDLLPDDFCVIICHFWENTHTHTHITCSCNLYYFSTFLKNIIKLLVKGAENFLKLRIKSKWKIHFFCCFCKSAFAKLRKATISFVMSASPHGTTRLSLDGFWWNLIFETFFENLSSEFKFN
jgi:hypothetical protein